MILTGKELVKYRFKKAKDFALKVVLVMATVGFMALVFLATNT